MWWTVPGSNRSPLPCHGSALPNELTALVAVGLRVTRLLRVLRSRFTLRPPSPLKSALNREYSAQAQICHTLSRVGLRAACHSGISEGHFGFGVHPSLRLRESTRFECGLVAILSVVELLVFGLELLNLRLV